MIKVWLFIMSLFRSRKENRHGRTVKPTKNRGPKKPVYDKLTGKILVERKAGN